MEILGVDMTQWSPLSALIVGCALIWVWSLFGGGRD